MQAQAISNFNTLQRFELSWRRFTMDNLSISLIVCLVIICLVPEGAQGGDYCRSKDSLIYCTHGCCGTSTYKHCCTNTVSIPVIAGGAVGGLVFLVIVIVVCCICCRRRRHAHGQVVNKAHPQIATVAGVHGQTAIPQVGYHPADARYGAPGPYQPSPATYGGPGPYQPSAASYGAPGPYQPSAASYGAPGPYQPSAASYGAPGPYQPSPATYGGPGQYQPTVKEKKSSKSKKSSSKSIGLRVLGKGLKKAAGHINDECDFSSGVGDFVSSGVGDFASGVVSDSFECSE